VNPPTTPAELSPLVALASQLQAIIYAACHLTRELRADAIIAARLGLAPWPAPLQGSHPAGELLVRLERAAVGAAMALRPDRGVTAEQQREALLLATLRACPSPQARALVHRVEAALATHPGVHVNYGPDHIDAVEYFAAVRDTMAERAATGDVEALAQLAATLEADIEARKGAAR
jgi:hypothetical protein